MHIRLLLPITALLAVLIAAPAGAASSYRVGISDQNAAIFDQSPFQALKLKRTRYLVPWNWQGDANQTAEQDVYLARARSAGFEVFVTFTAARGCWNGVSYSRASRCKRPSTSRYKQAIRAFKHRYPWIRVYAPWNEVNHKSQPTYRSAKLAASYWNVMRREMRGKTLVAADVLDSSNVTKYLRTFRRYAKGSPRRWGLHNYSDVNRKRSKGTTAVLRAVPGEVWLTETGGIVKFGSFGYSESRAASRTRYLFKLADRYDSRRRGMRSRITRIYVYQYTGSPRGARFDAGMVDADGTPRANYRTFKALIARRKK